MSWYPNTQERQRRVWTRQGRIDPRLVMTYLGMKRQHVLKGMGWTNYRYDGVMSRHTPVWPGERRKLAQVIGVDPPTVLALKMQVWDGSRGIHPPTGAFVC